MVAGDQSDPVDCLILGAGPGGYIAALRAVQLGRSVTLVERGRVGGVCLNEGCIPSKHLSRFAAAKASAEKLAPSGMPAFAGAPDMAAFQTSRAGAVGMLVKGVSSLLEAAGVRVITGNARFVGRTRVCVEIGEESVRYFDFKDVVIATGSRAIQLDMLPFDGERVVEPSRALEWGAVPASLLVAGDDYISLEIAVAYARLGSRVTLAAPGERLLPDFDSDLSAAAQRGARSAGVEVIPSSDPSALAQKAERVVVSAGRRANLDGLDLPAAGLTLPSSLFKVDAQMRLDRHVFAIGDVTVGLPLAHRAMMQGRVAGDVLGGKAGAFDSRAIPRAVFAEPEIAAVGMTEAEAQSAGIEISIGRFPLAALGRAMIESATPGFSKLIFAKDGGALLGAHLAGPRSTELIAEMALALEMGATSEDLALTVHAHPTFAESLMEAAEVSLGRPIHVRPAKK
ncbi:MAG TPA: FAD-dependent oxidoreductase [Candidatus Dormibacteraeota bacterium]|nr:FAD-dependent oxidoreductase [Candidatus Dormibacteraeota bacterium]